MVLVPDPPMNLLNNPLVTLDDRIGLIWNDGLSNGGQQIIDYEIYFDQSTGVFIQLEDSITQR
jgi:hypothetical protein